MVGLIDTNPFRGWSLEILLLTCHFQLNSLPLEALHLFALDRETPGMTVVCFSEVLLPPLVKQ